MKQSRSDEPQTTCCVAFMFIFALGLCGAVGAALTPEVQTAYEIQRCQNCWHKAWAQDDFKCPADLLTDNSLAGCITESGVACWHEDGTDEIVCDVELPESPSCSTCPLPLEPNNQLPL